MKLRLRQYKPCDADRIVSWIKDEEALRKWSADRFGDFPITSEDINNKYFNNNGDCIEDDNFYPVTAFDENGVVGHLILRYTDKEKGSDPLRLCHCRRFKTRHGLRQANADPCDKICF